MELKPIAALEIATQRKTNYPPPFAAMVAGRIRRRLGDHFGLSNFGVNLTELEPGAMSALLHHHTKQDELIYILSGTPTLVLDDGEHLLQPGDCCGFKAGNGKGHHLVNRTQTPVVLLEIGDRTPGDEPAYPRDDLELRQGPGGVKATHKDGTPY